MERRMESREAMRNETVAQSGNGHAGRFLPTNGQFHTRSCARCAGLLVNEWCYDLVNTGAYKAEVLRCVQCGYRVDSVILQNQSRPPVANHHVRHMHPKRFVSVERLSQAA